MNSIDYFWRDYILLLYLNLGTKLVKRDFMNFLTIKRLSQPWTNLKNNISSVHLLDNY